MDSSAAAKPNISRLGSTPVFSDIGSSCKGAVKQMARFALVVVSDEAMLYTYTRVVFALVGFGLP